jgi:Flp pilus assembly protein TadD
MIASEDFNCMSNLSPQAIIDEATFEFTMGDAAKALKMLASAAELHPDASEVWHAIAEIAFAERDLDLALNAGKRSIELDDNDVHYHTTLSRIYMERGDKEVAEVHGARARLLGWKAQLKEEPSQ